MKRSLRAIGLLAMLAALSSCSYVVGLHAGFIGGRLAFRIQDDPPVKPGPCLHRLSIMSETGETMWEFDRPAEASGPCPRWLPIFYGTAPAPAEIRMSPKTLRTGTIYLVEGSTFDMLKGAFRLRRQGRVLSVENLDWESAEVQRASAVASDRRQENYRRAFEERERQRLRDVEADARVWNGTEPPPEVSTAPLPAERRDR